MTINGIQVGWQKDGDHSYVEQSVVVDMAEELDTLEDKLMEDMGKLTPKQMCAAFAEFHNRVLQSESQKVQARVLQKVVGVLIMRDNAKLQGYGIAFAAGLDNLNGLSMTEAGHECSVTRQAVSKVTNEWADILGLPRSRYMKSEKACAIYSKTQKENHWRNRMPSKKNKQNERPENKGKPDRRRDRVDNSIDPNAPSASSHGARNKTPYYGIGVYRKDPV